MAKPGKKNQNLKVLADIYSYNEDKSEKKEDKKSLVDSAKQHFSDPGKVDRWLTGAILFFGIFGVIFGFFHFNQQLRTPFLKSIIKADQPVSDCLNGNCPDDLLGLRQKDTDQDGLSDYDELNVYGTSPYLADSDSDRVSDSKEIVNNTDPNCPQGKNCFIFSETSQPDGTSTLEAVSGNINSISQFSADELRSLLSQSGVDQKTLNSISDEELMAMYQGAVAENLAGTSAGSSQSVELPVDDIANLTPQQLRQLLRDKGVSEQTLVQISDADLMGLVKETLQEY